MDWRTEVCNEARTWLSTPYVPHARIKGVGTDCGGLLYEVYNPHFGPFPAVPEYTVDWAVHSNDEKYLNFILPLTQPTASLLPGDFSLFHLGLVYAHAAIWLGDRYIHAWGRLREGRVTETPMRVMKWMAKKNGNFPIRHFTPVVK